MPQRTREAAKGFHWTHTRITMGGVAIAAAAAGLAGPALAQQVTASYLTPDLDRWMYPFNATPGTRTSMQVFGALGVTGFDNRDGQALIGWDTTGQVTPGLGEDHYHVQSARVIVQVSNDLAFTYDPTVDHLETYFDSADPAFVADADAGRPLEMFAVGYRGTFDQDGTPVAWDSSTFVETSPFTTLEGQTPGSFDRLRVAYAAAFDENGVLVDASDNVRDSRVIPTDPFVPFEPSPLGVGAAGALAAGDLVPVGTLFTFELDLSDPNYRAYLARGLNEGRLRVAIATMHEVAGQGDVGTPVFATKEDPFGTPARLELTVCVGSPADLDCSGTVDVFDLLTYLDSWFAGEADLDGSGATDVFDLLAYLDEWFAG